MFRIEQMVTIAPRLLGQVHRLIGEVQQNLGFGRVLGEQGDTDAGRDGGVVAIAKTDRLCLSCVYTKNGYLHS